MSPQYKVKKLKEAACVHIKTRVFINSKFKKSTTRVSEMSNVVKNDVKKVKIKKSPIGHHTKNPSYFSVPGTWHNRFTPLAECSEEGDNCEEVNIDQTVTMCGNGYIREVKDNSHFSENKKHVKQVQKTCNVGLSVNSNTKNGKNQSNWAQGVNIHNDSTRTDLENNPIVNADFKDTQQGVIFGPSFNKSSIDTGVSHNAGHSGPISDKSQSSGVIDYTNTAFIVHSVLEGKNHVKQVNVNKLQTK